jgi:hypothetical protein
MVAVASMAATVTEVSADMTDVATSMSEVMSTVSVMMSITEATTVSIGAANPPERTPIKGGPVIERLIAAVTVSGIGRLQVI